MEQTEQTEKVTNEALELVQAAKHANALFACLKKAGPRVPKDLFLIAKTVKMAVVGGDMMRVPCPICKGTGVSEDAQTGSKEASCRWCESYGEDATPGYVTQDHAKKIHLNMAEIEEHQKRSQEQQVEQAR